MSSQEFKILGKIDLSQFDRPIAKKRITQDTNEKAEDPSGILTKEQEIEACYAARDNYDNYPDEYDDLIECDDDVLVLYDRETEEEWAKYHAQEEEERERLFGPTVVKSSSIDYESEVMGALYNGNGDLVGF